MINEERVKELCHMAVFDEHSAKECRQMGEYYMWDYVGKELVKSFFSGTIAYLLLLLLWGIRDMEMLTEMLNSPKLKELIGWVLLLYVVFMAVYMVLTAIIYCVRYVYGRKKLRRYAEHIKKVRRMYYREEQMNR
ncbi:MAG: hypothetical protein ACI4FX_03870 [Agathobacter sp.]